MFKVGDLISVKGKFKTDNMKYIGGSYSPNNTMCGFFNNITKFDVSPVFVNKIDFAKIIQIAEMGENLIYLLCDKNDKKYIIGNQHDEFTKITE
jgi:hypothetical protein